MKFLSEIKKILKDDARHTASINIGWYGITVYLDDDPEKKCEEKYVIPIYYDVLEEYSYIPDSEYRSKCQENDYGIDLEEIIIIQKIMKCLEKNKEEIHKFCHNLDCEFRKDEEDEKNENQGNNENL